MGRNLCSGDVRSKYASHDYCIGPCWSLLEQSSCFIHSVTAPKGSNVIQSHSNQMHILKEQRIIIWKLFRLPEWEEICAVAMSVQNMHLMTTALDHVGAFWSSHTWCKAARDSMELRKEYFGDLLPDSEDRVFGALVLGKYPEGKKYRSTRTEMSTKVVFRKW